MQLRYTPLALYPTAKQVLMGTPNLPHCEASSCGDPERSVGMT